MTHPDFRHLKTHTFRGIRYKLVWRRPRKKTGGTPDYGSCDDPTEKGRKIHIYPRGGPIETLGTVIHEGMHGALFDIDEGPITATEEDIIRLLKRMGIQVSFHPKKRHAKTTKKRKKQ